MKIELIRLGKWTKLYKMEGGNRKDRYINYNKILFQNIENITVGTQQIIILNESMNGGVVYGNGNYTSIAFNKLKKYLSKYKLEIIEKEDAGAYRKISFSISKREYGWDKLRDL